MKKKVVMLCVLGTLIGSLAGCSVSHSKNQETNTTVLTQEETKQDEDENYETGDASLDKVRNEDGIGEKELLVVSFGTSYNDNRRVTIGAIEQAMEDVFGTEYDIRRGFTSQIIIDHVNRRDGILIDNVKKALDRAVANNVKTLVVQPTHLMSGLEYNDVIDEVAQYADAFEHLVVGKPLLTSDEDFEAVMKAITEDTQKYDDGKTAICYMGHGTEAESNEVYPKMQDLLSASGYTNYFIGTVEAAPTLEDVAEKVKAGGYEKVVLAPLMIVAGDHANNDMAGSEEDSWKTVFEKEGLEVTCLLRGLGELPAIQERFVLHAREAMEEITPSDHEIDFSKVASSSEMASPEDVVGKNMTPITADMLVKGTYDISVDSSSSMFNVTSCKLTVEDDKMTAEMTMNKKGYLCVYMGTGEEASKANKEDYIAFVENSNGEHTFTVPVKALDAGVSCAAFSKKKEQWYDRTLVFRADSLPQEAFAEGMIVTCSDLLLEDGVYSVDVSLAGGSGKAKVTSPTNLTIKDGKATVTITWSSNNYDYMVVDGIKYEAESIENHSIFEIPVLGFDYNMPVRANTTAMSTPHEIDYTLYFEKDSIKRIEE